jgi:hypothetical protein
MKILLFLIITIIIACAQAKLINSSVKSPNKTDSNSYRVYKIDSINSYYLIYAKKSDTLYKIVSKKEKCENCNMIYVNGVYLFKLHSSLYLNGKPIIPPASRLEISGLAYDKFTEIKFEGDSIRDLYYADNIKGLCFIKIKKK